MSPLLLAIDGGGTSTRCVAVQGERCIGFATAGGSNPVSTGLPDALASMSAAVVGAVASTGLGLQDVRSVTVAMAGISTELPFDVELPATLGALGVEAPVRFESDAAAGFCSGTAAAEGSVLISGTGAAAMRMAAGRTVATADGLGWLLGDVGSGFWIGRRVVRAALADLDSRGPETALTALLLSELALPVGEVDVRGEQDGRSLQVTRILTSVYSALPVRLARLAPLAFAALSLGDEVATEIVDAAARGLVSTLCAVMGSAEEPVVATGGLLAHQPALRRRIEGHLRGEGLEVALIPVLDGLTGAAVLALRGAGTPVDDGVRVRLQADIDGLRVASPRKGDSAGASSPDVRTRS